MRRANGSGSVYKLSGNRHRPWMAVAPNTYTDNGKAQRHIIGYYKTRSEAERALLDYNDEPYDTETAARTTFGEIFNKYAEKHAEGKSESVAKELELNRRRFEPLMQRLFRSVKYQDLEKLMSSYKGLSYSSKTKIKSCLSGVYQLAIKYNIATKDLSNLIEIGPNVKSTVHKSFSIQEIQKLYAMRDEISAQNILILIYTGLRPREALMQPITQEDIERGYFVAIGVKNESSKGRIVPIHPCIAPFLQNRRFLIESTRYEHKPISYSRLRGIIAPFGHLPHDGRHTCATLMKYAGVEEFARKRILGHTGGNVTDDVYTHLSATYLIREYQKLPFPNELLAIC